MLKNRLTHFLLLILVVLAVSTGGVFAYMVKQTDMKENRFVPAKLECEVVEVYDSNVKSSIQVKNLETSDIGAYLRVKLVTYWVDENDNIVGKSSPTLPDDAFNATGWIRGTDNTFYYVKKVEPNELTSNLLVKNVTLLVEEVSDIKYYQVIEVFAEAIQADGTTDIDDIPAVTDAWGVTLDTEGNINGFKE